MSTFRYKAFISYSHKDERWASWLHRALESYRVPRKLIGTGPRKLPGRIRPIFRDRDDLSSAADLSGTIRTALAESENLIVICSPAAAESHWVKEEIREFTRLGRREKIFCIIVGGDITESGSVAGTFPCAIAEAGLQEPLAADARKWADGKRLAKLKLIAGMLGVPLDQLRRRELQKRRRIYALAGLASLFVITLSALAVMSWSAAQHRRDSGESLVGFKLNQLRTLIDQSEDPEQLNRLNEWNTAALAELVAFAGSGQEGLSNEALKLQGRGIKLLDSGEFAGALQAFENSWVLQAEVYRRDRANQSAFFELGQAEYWIGVVHFNLGELDPAEAAFMAYAEITRRLILLQPQNSEWVLEMAYALTNLGMVQKTRDDNNPDRVLQFMQSALEFNQIALVLEPDNEYYRSELGQSHLYLAQAQSDVCDLEGSLQTRQESVALETGLSESERDNPEKQLNLAFAYTGLARIHAALGHNRMARDSFEKALELIEAVARQNPGDRRTRRLLTERRQLVIWLDAMSGRIDEAWAESERLAGDWKYLLGEDGSENVATLIEYSRYLLDRAWLANARGDTALAIELLADGMDPLITESERLPDSRELGNALTLAAFRYWEITRELPPENLLSLLPDYRAYNGRTRACADASRAVSKAVMLGEPEQAADLVSYLLDRGYRETGFMRICKAYYSCAGQR